MNFNEAFKIWYRADDVSELNPEVITAIKNAYLADEPVIPVDVKDPFQDRISAYCNVAHVLVGLTRTYNSSRLKNCMTTDSNNIFSLYAGTSGLKIQKELMELVHPESLIYGVKFIRWMSHRITNHTRGRDLFYDEDRDPQPAAPEKPEECEDRHDGWWCTKEKGHVGDHEAGGPSDQIYAIWPNPPRIGEPSLSKVEDYKILTAFNAPDLQDAVKEHCTSGYILQGGVSMAIWQGAMQILYAQAVIKYNN